MKHGGSSLPLESLQYIGRAAITVTECDYRSKSVDIHICCSTGHKQLEVLWCERRHQFRWYDVMKAASHCAQFIFYAAKHHFSGV